MLVGLEDLPNRIYPPSSKSPVPLLVYSRPATSSSQSNTLSFRLEPTLKRHLPQQLPGKKRKYAAVPAASASTSGRPIVVVDNAAAISEATLEPAAEETAPAVAPPTASTKTSKYRGRGKASKDA